MYKSLPKTPLLVLLLLLMGCGTSASVNQAKLKNRANEQVVEHKLRKEAGRWMGTPHVWGGTSTEGVDCSALVQNVFRDAFDVNLPRTTLTQSKAGNRVRSNLRAGDLIFYRIDAQTRHVGIYLSNDEFLHASESRGVTISDLNNPYWQDRLWTIRRVIDTAPESNRIAAEEDSEKSKISW